MEMPTSGAPAFTRLPAELLISILEQRYPEVDNSKTELSDSETEDSGTERPWGDM
jgi:hypothetical protein